MRIERIISWILIASAAAAAAVHWRKASLLAAENDRLRARLSAMESERAQIQSDSQAFKAESEKLKAQTTELLRLRGEVTQLRSVGANVQSLTAENQRLRAENQQLRSSGSALAPAPQVVQPVNAPARDQFPRETWNFAGYASPEAALISAIWAMKEGNPKVYLDSLAPQEQQRMAQIWQGKSETEIAEKHKSDVSAIAGLRVLERQNVSPGEVTMSVFLEGPGRTEKIRMHQVGQEWKFGGFLRDQQ